MAALPAQLRISRVIARTLRVVPVVVAAAAAVLEALLVRNAIAAAKSATLRVHAPRHREVVWEAMVVEEVEVEDTAVLVEAAVAAVKKHGAHSFYPVAWHLA